MPRYSRFGNIEGAMGQNRRFPGSFLLVLALLVIPSIITMFL
jgi:hypothetical protein